MLPRDAMAVSCSDIDDTVNKSILNSFAVSLRISRSPRKRGGFALVATISLMVLLLMVVLAMLSLSTITSRGTGLDKYQQVARANARLGLMQAIGELQQAMGPDQRVSAEGGLSDEAGFGKSHWVGVWSSADADGDLEPDGEFKGWLVSSATAVGRVFYDEIKSDASADNDDWVSLVGEGSVNTGAGSSGRVLSERVRVSNKKSGHSGSSPSGHYAWWVGDEGVKARIDLQNTQDNIHLASQGAQRASVQVLPEFETVDSSSPEVQKLVTTGTMDTLSGISPMAVQDHFHDMTVHSLALHTDTRRGGFK